jgi:hypothetical protein
VRLFLFGIGAREGETYPHALHVIPISVYSEWCRTPDNPMNFERLFTLAKGALVPDAIERTIGRS